MQPHAIITPLKAIRMPLDGYGYVIVRVRGVRFHGWCYLAVCVPSAPRGE